MSQPSRPSGARLTKPHYLLTWMNAMQGTYNNTTIWSHDNATGRLMVSVYNRQRREHEEKQRLQVRRQRGKAAKAEVKHETGRLRAVSAPLRPVSPKIKQEPSSAEAENTIATPANSVDSKSKPEQGSFEGHKQAFIYAVEQLRGVLYQREMMKSVRKEVDGYLEGLESEIKKAYDHEKR